MAKISITCRKRTTFLWIYFDIISTPELWYSTLLCADMLSSSVWKRTRRRWCDPGGVCLCACVINQGGGLGGVAKARTAQSMGNHKKSYTWICGKSRLSFLAETGYWARSKFFFRMDTQGSRQWAIRMLGLSTTCWVVSFLLSLCSRMSINQPDFVLFVVVSIVVTVVVRSMQTRVSAKGRTSRGCSDSQTVVGTCARTHTL